MDRKAIVAMVRQSGCFVSEAACLERAGCRVAEHPRLFKRLEHDKVRLLFPTLVREIDAGTAVALICLFDLAGKTNIYAHTAFAGPDVNTSLKSLYVPLTQAKPQPGPDGNIAIVKFVDWKRASWTKFLNDELELGTEAASAAWLDRFFKALDRMYGGGNLVDR